MLVPSLTRFFSSLHFEYMCSRAFAGQYKATCHQGPKEKCVGLFYISQDHSASHELAGGVKSMHDGRFFGMVSYILETSPLLMPMCQGYAFISLELVVSSYFSC